MQRPHAKLLSKDNHLDRCEDNFEGPTSDKNSVFPRNFMQKFASHDGMTGGSRAGRFLDASTGIEWKHANLGSRADEFP